MKTLELEAEARAYLVGRIAEFIGGAPDEVDSAADLSIYGIDSTDLLTLMFDVEQRFATTLHPGVFIDAATIDRLAQRIAAELGVRA
jgi:acyl carrier protein